MIAALKFLHIATMLAWCAALVALPVLLAVYGDTWRNRAGGQAQARYAEFRLITHYGYIGFATPAAIISIAAGTALIFAAGVFDLWFAAKLALVSGMALVHAWIGQLILISGEQQGRARLPHPLIALALGLPLMAGVLWLVLAKPDLSGVSAWMPAFMLSPRGAL
ncbi:MAG: CopD family protein [Paracoccus sp. (in: a-proteobacteria)]|uniref:CopD family protein n=1 Tax=Paracoccus sp. TaxID=267 RepID=UPI0026DEF60B|nr:CopD family protein [Paracoccus sp. (in: a-proteobacteria)]MDO5630621.1 CopD family protein [Paracoccus sp. (in: a-proteobacteria)]